MKAFAEHPNLARSPVPARLQDLCNKLLSLRIAGDWVLQNGDRGYASAPSNIALLKYWGKRADAVQMPANPNLSFTLGGFRSFTFVEARNSLLPWEEVTAGRPQIPPHEIVWCKHAADLRQSEFLHGCSLDEKQQKFLNMKLSFFAPDLTLRIVTFNNFPTACGVASSASGFAAMVGALADLFRLQEIFEPADLQYWLVQWARLGSGSATRSAMVGDLPLSAHEFAAGPNHAYQGNETAMAGRFVAWHCHESAPECLSQTVAVPAAESWHNLCSCVVVFSEHKKEVLSSQGHKGAESSPLYAIRKANTAAQFPQLVNALCEGHFNTVAQIAEADAFAMHSVMQTTNEPARYLSHRVGFFIAAFCCWRDANAVQAFWTLDAGPNVHILFLAHERERLHKFFADYFDKEDRKEEGKQHSHVCILENASHRLLELGKKNYHATLQQSDALISRWTI